MTAQQQLIEPGPAAPKPNRRREGDRYLTKDWQIKALLEHFPEIRGESLGDPCCGDGRMASMFVEARRFKHAFLNDLDADAPAHQHRDGADLSLWRVDWEVSNFPFESAGEIVWAALQRARLGVAALLRCTFGEPCNRSHLAPRGARRWLVRCPPTGIIMMPRVSYTGDGKCDSAPHWWFIWSKEIAPRIVVVDALDIGQLGLEVGDVR